MGDTDGVLGAGRGDCDADIIIGLSCPSLILAHSQLKMDVVTFAFVIFCLV